MPSKVFRLICIAAVIAAVLLFAGMASAEKTILLTFAGDVTLGGKDEERNGPDSFDSVAKAKGYDYFFANFREMFEQDDLTFVNLEQVLSDNKSGKSSKLHPLRGKTDFAKILPMSGVDLVSLANNHTGDYSKQGEKSTRQALEENGVNWIKEYKYYMFEKDGVRIAFFAIQTATLNTEREKLRRKLKEARENDGADAVILYWHTGTEYKAYHEPDTESRAKTLLEQDGVDMVIISHSHVAQGMGIFNNRCVFYSLGNFVFGGNRNIRAAKIPKDPYAISLYAMVVQAKLTFSEEGKYLGQQVTVYPVFTSSSKPDYQLGEYYPPSDRVMFANDYKPMRLTVEQAKDVYECFRRDTAFEIPAMTEKNGLAEIFFPYMPAFDGVMIPEDTESTGPIGIPEASSPKLTREEKTINGD